MSGLTDVRLSLHGQELQGVSRLQLCTPPAGMSFLRVMVHRWRTRQGLLSLTEEQLLDIGLTAAQARDEGLKPFWRG